MKAKEILNKMYAQKCQELADVGLNLEKAEEHVKRLTERKSDLKKDIEALQAALPICEEVERALQPKDEDKSDAG